MILIIKAETYREVRGTAEGVSNGGVCAPGCGGAKGRKRHIDRRAAEAVEKTEETQALVSGETQRKQRARREEGSLPGRAVVPWLSRWLTVAL
jgi:hypothetical protein